MDDVQSGVVLSGLENGRQYQIKVKAHTYNTELELELTSEFQTIYAPRPASPAANPLGSVFEVVVPFVITLTFLM